jgi:hypothetical protein
MGGKGKVEGREFVGKVEGREVDRGRGGEKGSDGNG